jgi:hypothetical protein
MAQSLETKRTPPPDPAHYAESSARENLIEHVFLGELLCGLWRKNVRDHEVLRPEVDSGGYDLALEFRGLTRHIQLKSSFTGARRSEVTAHVKLLDRPSACILWIFFDPGNSAARAVFLVWRRGGRENPAVGGEDSKTVFANRACLGSTSPVSARYFSAITYRVHKP